jgi:hypothetical protein
VGFDLKSEVCSVKCSLEVVSRINERHGVFEIMFLPKFFEGFP